MARVRNWCFTWNNPDLDYAATIDLLKPHAVYLVFQKERGEEGTEHYQGYLEALKALTLGQCKKIHGQFHWERRRGTAEEARTYCMKEDSRIEGPWEYGTMKKPGHRSDLDALYALAKSGSNARAAAEAMPATMMIYNKAFDRIRIMYPPEGKGKVAVHLFLGLPGTGKTMCAKTLGLHDLWQQPIRRKPDEVWFDGYDGHRNALLDEYRGQLEIDEFMKLLQPGPILVPVKGGHTWWNPWRIFITSNYHPDTWYPALRSMPVTRIALLRRIHYVWEIDGTTDNPVCHQGLDYFGIRHHFQDIVYPSVEPIDVDHDDDLK